MPASITFAGYAEGPAEALAGVQVVLNLSRFAESFGRTVAEAMAARRPVIAYRWGALPELVDDGVTGFLVPYGEAEAAVAAVAALLADRSLIGRMGEAGRASVTARYDKPAYRAAMEAAYREILATPPHGGGGGSGGPGGGPSGGLANGLSDGGFGSGRSAGAPAPRHCHDDRRHKVRRCPCLRRPLGRQFRARGPDCRLPTADCRIAERSSPPDRLLPLALPGAVGDVRAERAPVSCGSRL